MTALASLAATGIIASSAGAKVIGPAYDCVWSPETVRSVSQIVRDHTTSDDEVMSGAVIWEFEAGRRPFLNISHPLGFINGMSDRTAKRITARLASRPPRLQVASPGPTPEYGAYLVETGGCRVCHRQDLRGGLHPLSLPDEPPPPDLTAGGPLGSWSEQDFVRAMRTGITPDGRRVDPEWMPWPAFAGMSDLELRAIFLYLSSIAPR